MIIGGSTQFINRSMTKENIFVYHHPYFNFKIMELVIIALLIQLFFFRFFISFFFLSQYMVQKTNTIKVV